MVLGLRFPCTFPAIEELAIPAVCVLILFLAYTSQYLFYYIEPGPLSKSEAIWFNVFVLCIWYCYDRACTVDPGRKGWVERYASSEDRDGDGEEEEGDEGVGGEKKKRIPAGMRWCKKCEAVKPPRAHHCRKCGRCIPKMDHHCPWTSNCVSHTTFPHFLRFVFYAILSMSMLAYFLYERLLPIWANRSLPSYLGPSAPLMSHLLILTLVNGFVLLALSILFIHAVHSMLHNTSMIENWEIERHAALVKRAKKTHGFVYANGGLRVRITPQEFPYDVGFFANVAQAMGTSNPLFWFLPFGGAPDISSAGAFPVNGFEDASKTWPPPDPDKMSRTQTQADVAREEKERYGTVDEEREAFKRRQEKDYERWGFKNVSREEEEDEDTSGGEGGYEEEGLDGEEGWTNSDGDRLRDYGVDEDAEVIIHGEEEEDEDDIPLGELLRRRKARKSTE